MSNSWIGKLTRKALYGRDALTCCYCGIQCITGIADSRMLTKVQKKTVATLDHIVPQKELAAAATDDADFYHARKDPKNLVCVCMGCNSSKQHTPLYVWCKKTRRNYAVILAEISRRISIEI